MKNIIIAIIIILVLAGGFGGYKVYRHTQKMQMMQHEQTQLNTTNGATPKIQANDAASLDTDLGTSSLDQAVLSDTSVD